MAIISIITLWIHYDTYVYYNTIISIITFRTIMTLITFREPLWHIITKGKHYVHYIYYNTIISIIAFWTIITLMTLRHYYSLFWQLQNIMRISTFVIMAIIRIMVIKYFRWYRLKSGILCWILVLTGGKHSYIQGPGTGAEVLWKLNGVCTSFLA